MKTKFLSIMLLPRIQVYFVLAVSADVADSENDLFHCTKSKTDVNRKCSSKRTQEKCGGWNVQEKTSRNSNRESRKLNTMERTATLTLPSPLIKGEEENEASVRSFGGLLGRRPHPIGVGVYIL